MIKEIVGRIRKSTYWRDVAWLASGNAIAQAIGVLALPIITRLYTPADFALQSLFLQVTGFAVILLTWRYEYLIPLPKDDVDAVGLLVFVLCLGMITLSIATPLVLQYQDTIANIIGDPQLSKWLVYVPLTAIFISFSIAIQQFTQRQGKFRQSSSSEVVNKGMYICTALVGNLILPAPNGLMMSTAVGALGKLLWLSGLLIRGLFESGFHSTRFAALVEKIALHRLQIYKSYSRMSGSMVISHLLQSFAAIIPLLFIARTYGNEGLGQFALVASTIYLPSSLIGNAIGQVYYQRAAAKWSIGESFSDIWLLTAKRLIFVGIPIYTIIALISPWAYPFLFGDKWIEAGRFAVLMTIGAFFSFITSPMDRGCLIAGAWWYVLFWNIGRALTTLFVAWLASMYGWDIYIFLVALVIQMTFMYIIDYWANWRFSLLHFHKSA